MSVATDSAVTVDKAQFDAEFDEAKSEPEEREEFEATICFVTTIICPDSCDVTNVA